MSRHVRALLATSLALALGRCAPPGLGVDGGPEAQIDTDHVEFAYDEGAPICYPLGFRVIDFTEGAYYDINAVDEGTSLGGFQPDLPGAFSSVGLCPKSSLPAGVYTGSVRIELTWRDGPALEGSPLRASYRIIVKPVIRVDPAGPDLSAEAGVPTRFSVEVQLPAGVTDYDVTMNPDGEFISVVDKTPTLLTLEAAGLPPGTYTGIVTVSHGVLSAAIVVRYQVYPGP